MANMFGAGGAMTLQDLLGGMSLSQVQRMRQGKNPGGFGGDFQGISPQRLMLLAQLMQAQLGSGNAPQQFRLQHHQGDGLFHGNPMFASSPGLRQGQAGNGPTHLQDGPIQFQPGGGHQHGQPPVLVHPILGGGGNGGGRPVPGQTPGIVPPRIRRLAGKPPFVYPVR